MAAKSRVSSANRQSEAGAVKAALDRLGVVAPHTKKPVNDALLFGIGGGIGVGYYVMQYGPMLTLYVNTRIMTQESAKAGFPQAIADALGLMYKSFETPKSGEFLKKIDKALANGATPIVWAHRSGLKYYESQRKHDMTYHTIALLGSCDEGHGFTTVDLSAKPLTLSREYFEGVSRNPMAGKLRAMIIEPPSKPLDLKMTVVAGINACRSQMLEGWPIGRSQSNTGVNGLQKWASLLTDAKDKKGWPALFPTGDLLYPRLLSIFEQIELRGDRGAFRRLYADFLREAADVLGRKTLAKLADRFDDAAQQWSDLAAAFLPDRVPAFREIRNLLLRKSELFVTQGADARPEMQKINERLAAIEASVATSYPLDAAGRTALLADAAKRILAIAALERELFEALEG